MDGELNNDKQNSPAFRNCTVSYVPIFLGGLMHSCGNTPPIRIKSKINQLVNE